jgi:nitroreductase
MPSRSTGPGADAGRTTLGRPSGLAARRRNVVAWGERVTTIIELMSAQRTVRRFRPDPPPRERLQELIAAAITAPSTSTQPPWRFLVVTNKQMIRRLTALVRGALDRVAKRIKTDSFETYYRVAAPFSQLESAPALIVATYRPLGIVSPLLARPLMGGEAKSVAAMEEMFGVVSTSLALQNLLLAANACGFGAAVMMEPLIAQSEIEELLEVPISWHVAAMVAVGYPDEVPEPPQRPSVGSVTIWLE